MYYRKHFISNNSRPTEKGQLGAPMKMKNNGPWPFEGSNQTTSQSLRHTEYFDIPIHLCAMSTLIECQLILETVYQKVVYIFPQAKYQRRRKY